MNNIGISDLYSLDKTIARTIFEDVEYPWQVLPKIKDYIIQLGKTLPKEKYDEIDENVYGCWVSNIKC